MKKINTLFLLFGVVSLLFSQIDRSYPPKPLAEKTIKFGKIDNFTLKNGLKVIVVENHKFPIVRIDLRLDLTAIKEGNKVGFFDIFGSMMRAGTKNFTKHELDEKIDYLGSDFYMGSTYLGFSSLKKQLIPSLDIMKELLFNATFSNQEELDKLKKQEKTYIESGKKNPDVISDRVSNVLLYGKNDAWGEYKTSETIDNISLKDFENHHDKYFKSNIAYLTIVGDITKNEAKKIANNYFNDWEKGEINQIIPNLEKNKSGIKIAFVNLPTATQSSLNIMGLINLKKKDKEFFACFLGNKILGGGPSSRLFKDIREKKGWTYGVFSDLEEGYKRLGNFQAYAKVRNNVTDSAIVSFIKNINDIANLKPSATELNLIKSEVSGQFSLELEDPSISAYYIRNQLIQDLPANFYKNYIKNINSVTAEEIPDYFNKIITPKNLIVLVVGKASEILPKIKELGYPIEYYDSYGNVVKKPEIIVQQLRDITAKEVLNRYINATAGNKENAENLESLISKGKMEMKSFPQAVSITIKNQAPNKLLTIMEVKGQIIRQGYNGKNSFSNIQPLSKEEIEEMKNQKGIIPELFYKENEIIFEDIELINGKYYYKIKLNNNNNKSDFIQYYDKETGFKFKEESKTTNKGLAIKEYFDYKEFNGYKFPTKIITSMDGQIITIIFNNYIINPKIKDSEFK